MINDGHKPYLNFETTKKISVQMSSNLAFSQDMLLSDTSCLKSVASLQLRLPESTCPSQAHYDMGNWLNLGDHIFCNFHEENEVQSIGKGVSYFQTKPCCDLPIWIFGRAILVSHPEKQSKAVALICMDASAAPNTTNINQPTPLLTLPILSLVWCITKDKTCRTRPKIQFYQNWMAF